MNCPSPQPLELSADSVLAGSVRFRQPRQGYRVNIDSILLAHFAAQPANGKRVAYAADLGAGVGLVALLLRHFGVAERLLLIEQDPVLAELGRENLLANGGVAPDVVVTDVSEPGGLSEFRRSAELVVSNPPFYSAPQHQSATHPGRARARAGAIEPFVRAAAELVTGDKARAVFSYPAAGLPDLLAACAASHFVPKRLRYVHAFGDRPARLVLLEVRRSRPGGLIVEAPLFEWAAPGEPSAEMRAVTTTPAVAPRVQRPSKRSKVIAAAARTLK